MKEMYYAELNEIFQKISFKLQQNDSLPQQPKPEQLQKLRDFKQMLESLLQFLQLTKNNIPSRDKVAQYEKKIVSFLSTDRRKSATSLQQGQLPHMQSMQQFQQSHPQIPQPQSHDTGMNPQLQSLNMQNSTPNMQQSNMGSLQQGSVSSLTALASSNLDSGQQNVPSSMQQINLGSLQQNPVNTSPQSNVIAAPLKSGVSLLQPSISALQPNSNMLQNQHMKQQHEQQIMQSPQLKQQLQQRQIQKQLLLKQQLLQQQQLHQQTKQQLQQHGQMQPHQMSQVQNSDTNDIKIRQGMGLKPGVLPHHLQQGQRYPHQQVKPGGTFPNSPQLLQTASPQMNQHSSPQIDQQSMLPSLNKLGTPSQSANSPFVVPSPQTPLALSPMPGEPEKPSTALLSLSNAANFGHQQAIGASLSAPSLAIGTPGISASPLLAEFTMPDGTHGSVSTISDKPGVTEQPLQRLMKAVSSLSPKELNETVSDVGSIVSMIDRIAGSAPGNGSRAAIGEDLVAMTKCRLQARNFVTQEGSSGAKRMRRYTSAMPINVASPLSGMNGSFKQLTASDTSELESTATSNIKRLRSEVNHALLEEIREINERLIDTVVDINDEDINPTMPVGASDCGVGTIVKCSFVAVALSPALKAQYASQMSPIQPLRMLVPANYPNSSPILLDKFPLEASEYDDLSLKAKSRFRISLRTLSQPMSLKDIARTWDDCTRAVLSEYAQQSGGGTFSLKFGLWENCLTAA
ncbi:Mediator of RNA polymerase II transcription subunit 15a-like protein [Drosera capensis]